MRSGGFPCRFGGCDECFTVADQTSMPALLAASALRSQHETTVHGYTHVQLDVNAAIPSADQRGHQLFLLGVGVDWLIGG